MGMPDVDKTEIDGAVKEMLLKYGDVIGENQARNIAYVALVGARGAKIREIDSRRPGQKGNYGYAHDPHDQRRDDASSEKNGDQS